MNFRECNAITKGKDAAAAPRGSRVVGDRAEQNLREATEIEDSRADVDRRVPRDRGIGNHHRHVERGFTHEATAAIRGGILGQGRIHNGRGACDIQTATPHGRVTGNFGVTNRQRFGAEDRTAVAVEIRACKRQANDCDGDVCRRIAIVDVHET